MKSFRTREESGRYLKEFSVRNHITSPCLSSFPCFSKAMSLLQGVLRSAAADIPDDSDEDLVNVVSLPGTPDRTRPSSPVRGASSRPLPRPLHLSSRRDLLKALPTEVNQRIFSYLPIRDLARCALVSKKWNRSQTINYVWFQHYRRENFHDDSLPPGKWTKRESKQNWRVTHLKFGGDRSPTFNSFSRGSEYSSPSMSGYQTPRELKEEQWRQEAQIAKPNKLEMRTMYKELGGRKSRGKTKLGSSGIRDKGGWADEFRDL